jgi:hypothetical protein
VHSTYVRSSSSEALVCPNAMERRIPSRCRPRCPREVSASARFRCGMLITACIDIGLKWERSERWVLCRWDETMLTNLEFVVTSERSPV